MTKTCFYCHHEKDLSEFHVHRMMADGHLNKCKVCIRKDVSARAARLSEDPKWALAERNRHRDKSEKYRAEGRGTRQSPEKKLETMQKWRTKFPEKRKAHVIVANALKSGELTAMLCEKCGKKAEAHHEDYNKPLQVVWLCPKHHGQRHREIRDLELLTKL